MRKPRVLIADDEILVRRMITETLEEQGIKVAGVAANSSLALAKIPQVNPDIILLDLEFEGLTGLQTLKDIRKSYPVLPVIMLGSMKEKIINLAMEALALGAHDYVILPEFDNKEKGKITLRERLIPKIKLYCPFDSSLEERPSKKDICGASADAQAKTKQPRLKSALQRVDILAIGVSTGGPNALVQLLPELPKDFPVPIVIVQHMPPHFTSLLAKRLDEKSAIGVHEAVQGDVLKPGQAWVAPGDYHMVLKRDKGQVCIETHQAPPENSCRPSVDTLFRSVAEVYGAHVLAVILTGMGQDGLRGCERVYDANGQILVQDEKSSVVWGMPGFVYKAGLADQVLPLSQMGSEINKKVKVGRAAFAAV